MEHLLHRLHGVDAPGRDCVYCVLIKPLTYVFLFNKQLSYNSQYRDSDFPAVRWDWSKIWPNDPS